jgi:hypothetical protein
VSFQHQLSEDWWLHLNGKPTRIDFDVKSHFHPQIPTEAIDQVFLLSIVKKERKGWELP